MNDRKTKTIEIIGAISAIITILCTITTIILSYICREETTTYAEYLVKVSNYHAQMKMDAILSLTGGIFLILAAIGLFVFLRRKLEGTSKNYALIPLICIIIGSLIMICISTFRVYLVYYLVPKYINGSIIEQQYFLEKATNLISITNVLSMLTHIITFTFGAGSIGVLLYNKKIINDAIVWTALASGVLSLAKSGYFAAGTFGNVLVFLASIGSIFFYFFLGEMTYVIFQDHRKENEEKKRKALIKASLLE